MSDLIDLAARIASRAGSGEDVEAFLTHERNFEVKVFEGEVDSLSSAEPRGAGVRVFLDGKVGFAYTTELTDEGLDEVLERARDNGRHSTPEDANGMADPADLGAESVPGLSDPNFGALDADAKVRFALDLEAAVRSLDPRVRTVEEAAYADTQTEVAFATSAGSSGAYERSDAWCYVMAIAEEGDDTEIGFDFDLGRSGGDLDPEVVARSAVDRAVGVLGAGKIPSAQMPVVLDPYSAARFLGVLATALTAEAVQKGRSLFAGRIGDEVAAPLISLVDDGRIQGGPRSAPWDAEGVPTRRTQVISGGVLESFLYDTKTARRESKSSTGNAARAGFKSPPGVAPTNLSLDPTGESRDEVRRGVDRAFLVLDLHGVHSGANPVSGDFSVGATGMLLERGEPVRPVKEV
ncbi:MAG: TldD/PmbA family protein, partial [Actinomycetota bacterium]